MAMSIQLVIVWSTGWGKQVDVILAGQQKTKGVTFSDSWNRKNWWWERIPNQKNVFWIGGNTYYNQKNKIPMKIPEFERSGIGIIAEFFWIPNGFPNQDRGGVLWYSCRYPKYSRLTLLLHLTSSVVLIFLGHTNVSQNTFLGLFWSTGSYIAHGMRMTVSSMFFVLIATPLGLHGGLCLLVVHSGHPPYIVTHQIHEYHVDIPWIPMSLRGFHGTTWVTR